MAIHGGGIVWFEEIKKLGEGPALLLGYLRDEAYSMKERYEYKLDGYRDEFTLKEVDELEQMKVGWFPFPISKIRKDIGMSPARQTKNIKDLVKAKKIKSRVSGIPPTRWIFLIDQSSK